MGNIRYSEQFKRDAVRLVTEEGYSYKAAADAVGVCHTTIKDWVGRFGDQAPPRTRFASLEDELAHLRKENARLRMEREILKKAAAFFAKEEGTIS
jgi:transposase